MNSKSLFLKFLLLTTCFLNAQSGKEVNTTDLIFECTKYSGELPSKQMAIWYPVDFWAIVGNQMKFPPEIMGRISHELKDYLMFAVVDYTLMPTGKLTFKSEDDIRETILLVDSSKKTHRPLKAEEISDGANKLLGDLKPIMEKLLGQFGEGMRMVIFKAPNTEANSNFNISKKGSFTLKWSSTSLKWKLPFYTMVDPKFCPVDNEEMKGNWDFCPEHGTKLK